MTARGTTTIRLAAVQARSAAGQVEANLKHAEGLVEQAAGHQPRMPAPGAAPQKPGGRVLKMRDIGAAAL